MIKVKEKEELHSISYNFGYGNEGEDAHVRKNVEKEPMVLINNWKKV